MEKVWFKLHQTIYPPGPEDTILAGNGDDSQAPICLGHCIRDLRNIDFPINSRDVMAFPQRLNVFPTHAIDFKWDENRGTDNNLTLAAGSPLAVAAGLLTVKASIRLAFRDTVQNHEAYERLDTYIFQPDRHYVEDCLETESLRKYVDNRILPNWTFFMITGIRVARAGKRSRGESSGAEIGGGPGFDVPMVVTAEATGGVKREHAQKVESEVSDFVWAVRLAKVHKGLLITDWSIGPYTRKATFGLEEGEQVDVGEVVKSEGLVDNATIIDDEELEEAIVISDG